MDANYLKMAKNISESNARTMKEGIRLGRIEALQKLLSLIQAEITKLKEGYYED
jgi:hypothetical protein